MHTNSLPLGKGSSVRAIFPTISRICHSCLPNVTHTWNPYKEVESVYCLKTIMPGEEILTSYIDPYLSRNDRKLRLSLGFYFECKCELCSETNEEKVKKSDARREQMGKLFAEIPLVAATNPSIGIMKVKRVISLLKEEGIFYDASLVGPIAYDGFSIVYQSTKKDLSYWAKMTANNFKIFQGFFDGRFKNEVLQYC